MEMDSAEQDHDGKSIMEETSAAQFLYSSSADVNDIFGDPQLLPRVGDQYQVEIPALITECDRLHLMKNPADTEVMVDVAHSFVVGLPIPVMWVHDQVYSVKRESLEFLGDPDVADDTNGLIESESSKVSSKISSNGDSNVEVEVLDVTLDYGRGSGNFKCGVVGINMDSDLYFPGHEKVNLDQKYTCKGYFPVPGSLSNFWSNLELESFLLGLYIFGKNLVQVKRFIESKEMGDVLSYYYGEFYRSDGYRRWSECRKTRSRRCIQGQRIFTGWRQQELLSRLLPNVSVECQNTLLEVSKMFGEGKVLLEDYVSTLKATVGMSTLVEAIGIGKGKQDLTGIMDPIKANQVIPIRPEIPCGKECNSLTSEDIIKFLTGNFRLSKARSNDLFWEAVWPRLLARGWHSEQPKSYHYTGSKHSLVFLIPGIKKFSRRRLVKGDHYFDSVSDVLSKVALEPRLIEVDFDVPKGDDSKEEYGWGTEMKLDEDGTSDSKRHYYLQPQNSNINKFTVVDTSSVHGDGTFKVRKLRTLPVKTTNSSTPTGLSMETDGENSEEPVDEPDSTNMLLNDWVNNDTCRPVEDTFNSGMCSQLSGCVIGVSNQVKPINGPDSTNVSMYNQEDHYSDMCIDKHPRKTVKCQFIRRIKRSQSNNLAPVVKRRRLSACHAETSRSMKFFSKSSELKEQDPCCHFDSPDVNGESMDSELGHSQERACTSSSAKCSPDDSSEGIHRDTSLQKAEPRILIDLNLPHDLQDFDAGEPCITEVADSQDDPSTKGFSIQSEINRLEDSESLRTCNGVASTEQQSAGNARRHSTRNRPLTMRALEALASGFLYSKRTQRGTETMPRDNSIPRSSRRARGRVDVTANFLDVANGLVDPKLDAGFDEGCSSNITVGSESRVQSEGKGAPELVGVPKPVIHSEILAGKDSRSG